MTATVEQIRQNHNHIVTRRRMEDAAGLPARMADAESAISEATRRINSLEAIVSAQRKHIDFLLDSMTRTRGKIQALEFKVEAVQQGADAVEAPEYRRVNDIVSDVLKGFPGIGWADIISPRTTKHLRQPRYLCMYEVHMQRPDLSYPQIGRIFHRDHSSVLWAVKKIREAKESA
ncbi:helix-turn-helix domain-containing protein [Sinorhizobium meliloti]|uniref:helix-turn-helix domain-containing protein n=1 Tax=Rhizobium meliloti TaxID=382 RepID=UPI00398CD8C3